MELIPDLIYIKSNILLFFFLKQTVFTCILLLIIFPLSFLFRNKSPYWRIYLWTLILARLLLPTDLRLPINSHTFSTNIPVIDKLVESEVQINNKVTDTKKEFSLISIPMSFCLTGFIFLFFIFKSKSSKFRRILKNSSPVYDSNLQNFIAKWKSYLKIHRNITIVTSNEFLSPFTSGLLNPFIYIPQTFFESTNSNILHSIIAHEMVHIKRCDTAKILFQNILQIIYFFNPVVWYANRQISLAREEVCDSVVLASGMISKSLYGGSLIKTLEINLFGSDFAGFLPGFGNHKKAYKRRIKNINKEPQVKMQKKIFIVTAVCLLGIFILPMANYINASAKNNEKSNEFRIIPPINSSRITSMFGWRKHPVTKKNNFHNGIDIAAPKGTAIFAAADGLVVKAGWDDKGYGNLVILQHDNGYSSFYAKCDKIFVKKNDIVKAGDTIAACGRTGIATGNHLHFEIRKDGKNIDPYPFLPTDIPAK